MLRGFTFILALVGGVSCMKMRETVERTVMVRTMGSDLQPAATGYIYKKQNDGEESVIQMGESEVMEQLSKLYAPPKPFVPLLAKQAHEDKKDESKSESKNDERVIPVKEKAEEEHDDHIDGIADDNYKKIFDSYTTNYDDDGKSYDDYLRSLGHFDDVIYKGYKAGNDDDIDGYKGHKNKKYYNDGAKDYHNEKYESYSFSGKGEHKDGFDDDRKHYDNRKLHASDDEGARGTEHSDGYFKVFSENEKYKGHGSHGDGGKTFHSIDDGKHFEAGRRHEKNGSHESEHDKKSEEHDPTHSAEEESSQEKPQDYQSDGRQVTGNSYGFEVKH